MSNVSVRESYGTEPPTDYLILSSDVDQDNGIVRKQSNMAIASIGIGWPRSSMAHFFKTAFLPQGYPESVSEDYLEYQIWDTLQAFCSSITGTLATLAMLKGYGVGDQSATAAAATITWMLKDGAGMLGRILFAWFQGTQLDCDAKRWRLFADILNDCAILLELIAPLFKSYFLLIACVSGVAKSIVGVAGGATRAALTQHQARRDNMADVSAKDGSQETLVNLMALVAGLVITPLVANNQVLVWILFFIFTFGHLYSNYKAVSAVIMETINLPRYHILVCTYIETGKILTPKEVGKLDPVIRNPGYCLRIKLGTPFSQVIESVADLNRAVPSSINPKYVLSLNFDGKGRSGGSQALLKYSETIDIRSMLYHLIKHACFMAVYQGKYLFYSFQGSLNIALHKDVTSYELLQCAFQSLLLDAVIQNKISTCQDILHDVTSAQAITSLCSKWKAGNSDDPYFCWDLIALAHNPTIKLFPAFLKSLQENGWETERNQLGPDEWRFTWERTETGYKKSI